MYNKQVRKESLTKRIALIVVVALIAFFGKIPFVILGDYVVQTLELSQVREIFNSETQVPDITIDSFVSGVVFFPMIETIIGQWVPIALISRYTKSKAAMLIGSAGLFSLLHFPVLGFLPAAFMIGLVFSWFWLRRWKLSHEHAFVDVSLAHALHNLLAFLFTALIS